MEQKRPSQFTKWACVITVVVDFAVSAGVTYGLWKLRSTSIPFWSSPICWLEMRCCQALAADRIWIWKAVWWRWRQAFLRVRIIPSSGRNACGLFLPLPNYLCSSSSSSILPVHVTGMVNGTAGRVSTNVEQPGSQPCPNWSALCRTKKSQLLLVVDFTGQAVGRQGQSPVGTESDSPGICWIPA